MREMAPGATDARQYLGADGELEPTSRLNGPRAAAIPGEAAGLVAEHYGKPAAGEMLAPYRLAREGFAPDARSLDVPGLREVMARDRAASALFLPGGQLPGRPGAEEPGPGAHAGTLARQGQRRFLPRRAAAKLVDGVKSGGTWSLDDLSRYRGEREPIAGSGVPRLPGRDGAAAVLRRHRADAGCWEHPVVGLTSTSWMWSSARIWWPRPCARLPRPRRIPRRSGFQSEDAGGRTHQPAMRPACARPIHPEEGRPATACPASWRGAAHHAFSPSSTPTATCCCHSRR